MAKKKRILTEGVKVWLDPTDRYGESRFVQEIIKRGRESFEEMNDYILDECYKRILDC